MTEAWVADLLWTLRCVAVFGAWLVVVVALGAWWGNKAR